MAIPYLLLVAGAVGLQYLQMARLNARNPQAAQANPQAAMLQKYMPLIFGFIYLNVAAILNVYFIVSSAIRILTQEILFRKGIVAGPPHRAGGRRQAGRGQEGPGRRPDRTGAAEAEGGRGSGRRRCRRTGGAKPGRGPTGKGRPVGRRPPRRSRADGQDDGPANESSGPVSRRDRRTGRTAGNGDRHRDRGNGPSVGKASSNGSNGSDGADSRTASSATAPKEHPRSKAKRERKAR